MVAIVAGQIPGIPELTVVAPAAPLQRPRQLGQAISSPHLPHTLPPQLGRDQAIAQTPQLRGRGQRLQVQLHRVKHRQRWQLRPLWLLPPALQGHAPHTGGAGELHPLAAPRGQLAGQPFPVLAPLPPG